MARPKGDSEELSAKERLANAFWEALETKPLREITVAELCRRGKCNKTTFYYHFASIEELIDYVEQVFLATNFPSMLTSLVLGGEGAQITSLVRQLKPMIERARLLLGPGGDAAFSLRMQHTMFSRWCEMLGVSEADLDAYDAMVLRHAMGGTAAVLGADARDIDYSLLARVIVDTMKPHVDRMLERYRRGA